MSPYDYARDVLGLNKNDALAYAAAHAPDLGSSSSTSFDGAIEQQSRDAANALLDRNVGSAVAGAERALQFANNLNAATAARQAQVQQFAGVEVADSASYQQGVARGMVAAAGNEHASGIDFGTMSYSPAPQIDISPFQGAGQWLSDAKSSLTNWFVADRTSDMLDNGHSMLEWAERLELLGGAAAATAGGFKVIPSLDSNGDPNGLVRIFGSQNANEALELPKNFRIAGADNPRLLSAKGFPPSMAAGVTKAFTPPGIFGLRCGHWGELREATGWPNRYGGI